MVLSKIRLYGILSYQRWIERFWDCGFVLWYC